MQRLETHLSLGGGISANSHFFGLGLNAVVQFFGEGMEVVRTNAHVICPFILK